MGRAIGTRSVGGRTVGGRTTATRTAAARTVGGRTTARTTARTVRRAPRDEDGENDEDGEDDEDGEGAEDDEDGEGAEDEEERLPKKTSAPRTARFSFRNGAGSSRTPSRSSVPPIQARAGSIKRNVSASGRTTSRTPTRGSKTDIPFSRYESKVMSDQMLERARQIDPETREYRSAVVRAKKRVNSNIIMFHQAVSNVIRMLQGQNYVVPDNFAAIVDLSPVQFTEIYTQLVENYNIEHPPVTTGKNKIVAMTIRRALSGAFQHQDGHYIYVFFPEVSTSSKTTGNSDIVLLGDFLKNTLDHNNALPAIRKAIIVAQLPLSPGAVNKIHDYPYIQIRFFQYDELTYLPSEHFMSSEHVKLPEDEIRSELSKSGVNLAKLKTLAQDDPVVKELGFEVGDIIRIKRTNLIYNHLTPITYDYRRIMRAAIQPYKVS